MATANPPQFDSQKLAGSGASSASVDPQLVEQTKQQIHEMVAEITKLSESNIAVSEFLSGFMTRVVTALASIGGAFWLPNRGGGLELEYQANLSQSGLTDEGQLKQHRALIERVAAAGEPALIAPQSASAGEEAGNSTPCLLVIGVVPIEDQIAVVEIFQRPGAGPTTHRGYLRFLNQMCELAAGYFKNQRLRSLADRQEFWQRAEDFLADLHEGLDPERTAAVLANDSRRLVGCDRVSVAIRQPSGLKISAVSGLDSVERRAADVKLLEELCRAVTRADEPLWPADDSALAPQIERALTAYVDSAHPRSLAVIPLCVDDARANRICVGAIVVEQFEAEGFDAQARWRIELSARHGATALHNALEHQNIFLLPLWKTLGSLADLLLIRQWPKTAAAVLGVVAIVAALTLVQKDYPIHCRGELTPTVEREVFAGISGVVDEIYVDHGDDVVAGKPILKLRDPDLDAQHTQLLGQLNATKERLFSTRRALLEGDFKSALEEDQLAGKVIELQTTLDSLARQVNHLEEKRNAMVVTSPITGKVATWNVRRRLFNRDVIPGQSLLTVYDPTSPWELELYVPEKKLGYFREAQDELGKDLGVEYQLAMNPGMEFHGKVSGDHGVAAVHKDHGNSVLVQVEIDESKLPELREGAVATAQVLCGKKPLGWCWMGDFFDAARSQWSMWW